MDVTIFIPCFIDQLYPQTAVNMVTVLRQLGFGVDYNPQQTCCGQPAFNAGFVEDATTIADKFMEDFGGKQPIICPSASCVGFIRNHYSKLLGDKYAATVFERLQDNVFEFSEFLVREGDLSRLRPTFVGKAMYHDSCAALRECQIKEEPQQLLQLVKGLELVENPHSEDCCGFGGTFAVKFEPISTAMAAQKVKDAVEAGAECIISTDLSCLMHLQGYIEQQELKLKTYHLADVLL